MNDEYTYRIKDTSTTGLGTMVEFRGPGVHPFGNEVRLPNNELLEYQAERICSMLSRAYERGKVAKAHEVCAVLGVKCG
jgi:hypothetical protein